VRGVTAGADKQHVLVGSSKSYFAVGPSRSGTGRSESGNAPKATGRWDEFPIVGTNSFSGWASSTATAIKSPLRGFWRAVAYVAHISESGEFRGLQRPLEAVLIGPRRRL
jgi:hypothetical protein